MIKPVKSFQFSPVPALSLSIWWLQQYQFVQVRLTQCFSFCSDNLEAAPLICFDHWKSQWSKRLKIKTLSFLELNVLEWDQDRNQQYKRQSRTVTMLCYEHKGHSSVLVRNTVCRFWITRRRRRMRNCCFPSGLTVLPIQGCEWNILISFTEKVTVLVINMSGSWCCLQMTKRSEIVVSVAGWMFGNCFNFCSLPASLSPYCQVKPASF